MFEIISQKDNRRIGRLTTKSGVIDTPFFMPDATKGFVRSMSKNDMLSVDLGPAVVNTYHLLLEPGMELVKKAGGINKFMNWEKPLLSDSGGYQVFSLIHKNPELGKITDEEVIFRSPFDGKKHILSPERAIEIQFDLGVDMMVVLDDPPPNSYPKDMIEKAVERTLAWAKRCKIEFEKQIKDRKIEKKKRPLLFGVIQGGAYLDLREKCTRGLVEIGFDGYGFGARHLDENGNFMEEVLRETAKFIPEDSLRFALGVGTPEDIIRCFEMGWDMFDCVIPTREGRHGRLFIRNSVETHCNASLQEGNTFYETINISNERFKEDFTPVDPNCDCELCKNYTKSYLRHLFSAGEPLAMRLCSVHNLKFYMDLMKKLRP